MLNFVEISCSVRQLQAAVRAKAVVMFLLIFLMYFLLFGRVLCLTAL